MGKKRYTFKVESYQQSKGRCWGCCQENCGGCSCGCHTETETCYQVVRNDGKVVEAGLDSPPVDVKAFIKRILSVKRVRARFATEKEILQTKLDDVKKREREQIKRIKDLRGY